MFCWVPVLGKGVMGSGTTVMVQHRPHLRRSVLEPSAHLRGAAASDVVVLGCKAGVWHFQSPAPGTGCAEATAARDSSSPAAPLPGEEAGFWEGRVCRRFTPHGLLSCQHFPRGTSCCSCGSLRLRPTYSELPRNRELTPGCHASRAQPQPGLTLIHCSIICNLFYIILLATDELNCHCCSVPPPT